MPKIGMRDIRRAQLIDATLQSIDQSGLSGTTLASVAQHANISTGIVSHYFGGKDGLLEATMRHVLHDLWEATMRRRQAAKDEPRARLRAIYDWVVDNIGFEKPPHQYEFARLNITHTVMSKRYLRELVETGRVDGWDDPRMPTLCALRRRGYTPSSIIEFVKRAGVAKTYSIVDIRLLEYCIREELNQEAPRRMAVTEPVKLVITNYPDHKVEHFPIPNNPVKPESGSRQVAFSRELYVERSDFAAEPPPKWQRLKPGGEVRLMGAYLIRCEEVVQDDAGQIVELRCTCDLETRNGMPADGRKVRGTIHWVSAAHAVDARIMLYENLFTRENVGEIPEGESYLDYLNPDSLNTLTGCKLEASLAEAERGDRFQFVRMGYFAVDSKNRSTFNRIVVLKDSFKV